MSVFLEKYLLPIVATLTVLVLFTNPMGLNWRQRIVVGLVLLAVAFLVSYTVHKASEARKQPSSEASIGELMEPSSSSQEACPRLVAVVREPISIFRSRPTDVQVLSCELKKLQEVIALVEDGADVDATDEDGETALHWAAYYGHNLIVKYLLQHGADPNLKGRPGRTALDWAAGAEASIRLLRSRGTAEDKSLFEYVRKHINE